MELNEISYRVVGDGVAEILLDRPDTLNPISARPGGTRDQILHALELAEGDGEVGCIVLRGAGRGFSSGGDLTGNARRDGVEEDLRFLQGAEAFHATVRTSAVPVIAAVHGYCLGAAVSLAACCDLVLASEDARFGYPEGRLGLVGVSAVAPIIGRQWATFLMVTGELITAAQARSIGLVLIVEPDDELHERADELARRVARMPRDAVRLNRRAIDAVLDAAGFADARLAALTADAATLGGAATATAPDGRTFRSILDAEGMEGMKAARDAQYTSPWLRG